MVAEVYYPGLESHPDRDTLSIHTGMISFVVTGEDNNEVLHRARNPCENLRVINLAVSLGGVESLCKHPVSMTHTIIPQEKRMKGGLKDRFIRIIVGLERARDLVDDLHNLLDLCDGEGCDVPEDV